jgi:hypothetical protein
MRRFPSICGLFAAAVAAPLPAQPRHVDAGNVIRPQFTVEAISLKVIDETGIDFLGSDEIIVRFTVDDHNIYTGVFGDMDRGDVRPFPARMRCITPAVDLDHLKNQSWACGLAGRSAPITFTVGLYEYDGIVRAMLTNPTGDFCVDGGDDLRSGCHSDTRWESLSLGRYRQTFTRTQLLSAMPQVGMSMNRTLRIDPCAEFVTIDGGACAYWSWLPSYFAYDLNIRVRRNADARPVVNH